MLSVVRDLFRGPRPGHPTSWYAERVMASKVLAHHLPDPAPEDREELARLLKRDLKPIDVHVVLERNDRFRKGTVTSIEISDGNRHFYAPGISVEKRDGISKMVLRRQDGAHVTIDPADYSGDGVFGLDLGASATWRPCSSMCITSLPDGSSS